MSSYNNILFPFDSRVKSREPFLYAIDLAKEYDSNLIFLYAHRLGVPKQQKLISATDLKKQLTVSAEKQLEELRGTYQLDETIKYEFHPEIGFLSSRVIHKIREYPIDLLVIEKSILTDLNGAADQITCPIMIVPH